MRPFLKSSTENPQECFFTKISDIMDTFPHYSELAHLRRELLLYSIW